LLACVLPHRCATPEKSETPARLPELRMQKRLIYAAKFVPEIFTFCVANQAGDDKFLSVWCGIANAEQHVTDQVSILRS